MKRAALLLVLALAGGCAPTLTLRLDDLVVSCADDTVWVGTPTRVLAAIEGAPDLPPPVHASCRRGAHRSLELTYRSATATLHRHVTVLGDGLVHVHNRLEVRGDDPLAGGGRL